MKIVVFGLTMSSSWGNGHATLWRGLVRELMRRRHKIVFFEKDVPYYAGHRDFTGTEAGELRFYTDWQDAAAPAKRELWDADVAMVTSFCPDGVEASRLVLDSRTLRVFYDMDTPVTLEKLRANEYVPYLPEGGLREFDLVLSYTGGAALGELCTRLNARRVLPLYGSVDPEVHHPTELHPLFRSDFSYLGTYSEDRQDRLQAYFLDAAKLLPHRRFALGGSQYPPDFPWTENTHYYPHVAPLDHPAFYCSSRLTLNITRAPMAQMGYCPSGRLFEAAACGTPVISDAWEGLDEFFTEGEEIIVARTTDDVVAAIETSPEELQRIARAARERTLTCHTAARRAEELEAILESARNEATSEV